MTCKGKVEIGNRKTDTEVCKLVADKSREKLMECKDLIRERGRRYRDVRVNSLCVTHWNGIARVSHVLAANELKISNRRKANYRLSGLHVVEIGEWLFLFLTRMLSIIRGDSCIFIPD
jgi:hypothetical protein